MRIHRWHQILCCIARSLRGRVVAVAVATVATGCSDSASATLTLCSTARDAIGFVVSADNADPASTTGSLGPGARQALRFSPRSDGAYTIELRRGDEVVRHADVGYYTSRAESYVTITEDLQVTLGCNDR